MVEEARVGEPRVVQLLIVLHGIDVVDFDVPILLTVHWSVVVLGVSALGFDVLVVLTLYLFE